MAARLKVFVSSDGLTDYVVAVSSRAKALAAWGVRQDLFKEGVAKETDDAALRAEALAEPGVVLRRPAGSREALAKLKPVKRTKPRGPSKAALRKVAVLEQRLQKLESEAAAIEAQRSEALAAVEAKARTRRDAVTAQRRALKERLKQARRAAGGG
jgi:small-conductance mechanosensitive channel